MGIPEPKHVSSDSSGDDLPHHPGMKEREQHAGANASETLSLKCNDLEQRQKHGESVENPIITSITRLVSLLILYPEFQIYLM